MMLSLNIVCKNNFSQARSRTKTKRHHLVGWLIRQSTVVCYGPMEVHSSIHVLIVWHTRGYKGYTELSHYELDILCLNIIMPSTGLLLVLLIFLPTQRTLRMSTYCLILKFWYSAFTSPRFSQ